MTRPSGGKSAWKYSSCSSTSASSDEGAAQVVAEGLHVGQRVGLDPVDGDGSTRAFDGSTARWRATGRDDEDCPRSEVAVRNRLMAKLKQFGVQLAEARRLEASYFSGNAATLPFRVCVNGRP